jgi:hypothetical protein
MGRTRAILDTNVYLSYLLSPDPTGALVEQILYASAKRTVDLLLPIGVNMGSTPSPSSGHTLPTAFHRSRWKRSFAAFRKSQPCYR